MVFDAFHALIVKKFYSSIEVNRFSRRCYLFENIIHIIKDVDGRGDEENVATKFVTPFSMRFRSFVVGELGVGPRKQENTHSNSKIFLVFHDTI